MCSWCEVGSLKNLISSQEHQSPACAPKKTGTILICAFPVCGDNIFLVVLLLVYIPN